MGTCDQLNLFTCMIDMQFSPSNAQPAVRLLLSVVGRTEATAGCRACVVSRDAMDETRVRYTETWDSKDVFQRHSNSEEFRRVLAAMDMCCEEPQVMIGCLAGRKGIAHLQELCAGPGVAADGHEGTEKSRRAT